MRLTRGSVCRAPQWFAGLRPGGASRPGRLRLLLDRASRTLPRPEGRRAFACRNGNAALVGSSEPHALFTSTLLILASQLRGSCCGFTEMPCVDRKVGGREAAEDYLLKGRELLHGGSDAGDSNLRREFDRVALDR